MGAERRTSAAGSAFVSAAISDMASASMIPALLSLVPLFASISLALPGAATIVDLVIALPSLAFSSF